jgi:hypothetical protein
MSDYKTPGILLPTAYSSVEEFDKELKRRSDEAGFTELMHSSESVDEVLEHFGVRGMRWGVRRDRESGGGSAPRRGKSVSVDAARFDKTRKKVKTRGVSSLSNAELKALNERINLEQNYARLTGATSGGAKAKRAASWGGKVAGDILLNVGKQQASSILNQQVSKQLVGIGWKVAKG